MAWSHEFLFFFLKCLNKKYLSSELYPKVLSGKIKISSNFVTDINLKSETERKLK